MKYASLFLCVFLIVSLVLPLNLQKVKAQKQEIGSFGNPHISPSASVNWTRFWKIFNAHSAWDLEYNSGGGWISVKEALDVIRTYYFTNFEGSYIVDKSEATTCKIALNFTAPYTADYRLTFGIDLDVKSYVYRESKWQYQITYQNHTVIFDWSDLKNYTGLTYTHGIKPVGDETYFWFRVRRNNIPEAFNILLDPSFGYDTKGSSYVILEDTIRGANNTCPESCTVTEFHPCFRTNAAHEGDDVNWTGAIYTGNATHAIDLVYQTPKQTYTLPAGTAAHWINYTIPSEDKPDLTGGNTYHLIAWADTWGFADFHLPYDGVSGSNVWKVDPADFTATTPHGNYTDGYDPIDDDITDTYSGYRYSIYVNYTTDGVQEYSEEFSENISVSASLSRWRDVTFFYMETIVITETGSFAKELILEIIEFTELIEFDADLYLTLPLVPVDEEVSTFGTIALVIAIIALAIGIVAFTRRS